MLKVIALELADKMQWVDSTYRATIEVSGRLPECYRVDAVNMIHLPVGLGRQHSIAIINQFASGLYPRLLKLPELPEDIRQLCKAESEEPAEGNVFTQLLSFGHVELDPEEHKTRQKLVKSLIDQPDEKDLSWATLGYLIREISFSQAYWRISFYAHSLCTEVDEQLEEMRPFLEDHPLGALFEVLASDPARKADASRKIDEIDFTGLGLELASCFRDFSEDQKDKYRDSVLPNSDMVCRDLIEVLDKYANTTTYESALLRTRALLKVSCECPYVLALYINQHWDELKDQADRLMSKAGNFYQVPTKIAYAYYNTDEYEKSIHISRRQSRFPRTQSFMVHWQKFIGM